MRSAFALLALATALFLLPVAARTTNSPSEAADILAHRLWSRFMVMTGMSVPQTFDSDLRYSEYKQQRQSSFAPHLTVPYPWITCIFSDNPFSCTYLTLRFVQDRRSASNQIVDDIHAHIMLTYPPSPDMPPSEELPAPSLHVFAIKQEDARIALAYPYD